MVRDRCVHAAVWADVAMEGLMEAPGFELRRFVGQGDMLRVWVDLAPYDSRRVYGRSSKVGFTEIRQVQK